jgi:hypothetical protein
VGCVNSDWHPCNFGKRFVAAGCACHPIWELNHLPAGFQCQWTLRCGASISGKAAQNVSRIRDVVHCIGRNFSVTSQTFGLIQSDLATTFPFPASPWQQNVSRYVLKAYLARQFL